jgi:hypothetical protein
MRAPVVVFALVMAAFGQGVAAEQLGGHVYGGGGPVADSTVTLWAAGQGAPTQLSETRTKGDGAFDFELDAQKAEGGVLYLIARGGAQGRRLSRSEPGHRVDGDVGRDSL